MFSATAAGTSGRRSGRTSRPGCWTWRWAWCGAWPGDQSQHGIRSRDPVMSCYWPASPSSPSSSPASGTSTPPCSPWCCSSRLLTAQQSKGNIINLLCYSESFPLNLTFQLIQYLDIYCFSKPPFSHGNLNQGINFIVGYNGSFFIVYGSKSEINSIVSSCSPPPLPAQVYTPASPRSKLVLQCRVGGGWRPCQSYLSRS